MARTFRRKHAQHPISELNVTNLIDLGFTLLIIFMIATPLINQEQTLPVNLPVESKSIQTKPDPDDKFESITIRANGSINLGGRELSMGQLARGAREFRRAAEAAGFSHPDGCETTAQQFIAVMDELKKQRLFKITFDTQTQS